MGERHDADHPVAQARERLSEVGMGERREAAHSAAEARQRMGAIAEELARRANPVYVRTAAFNRGKERLTGNLWILGLIGAGTGAMAGRYLGGRALERKRMRGLEEQGEFEGRGYPPYDGRWDRPYDEYTATHEPMEGPLVTDETSLGGSDMHQAVGLGGAGRRQGEPERWRMPPEGPGSAREDERDRRQLGERARHMASHVRERLPNVRGHVPSRDELRRRTHELRHTTEEHPALWMLGAFAAGSLFASVMPVTEHERRLLGQARVRAQSGIEGLKQQAWGQFTGLKQTATSAAMEMVREIARGNKRGGSYSEGPAGGPQQPQGGSNWQPDGEPSSSRIRKYGPGGSPIGGSYHAGGTNEEERRESGWSPAPDPNDVTRH